MDDDWLIERMKANDPRAFDRLMREHEARLMRFATRVLGDIDLAGDAVQEVFIKLWRGRAAYEPCGKLAAYLYRVTYSTCLDIRRRIRPADDIDVAISIPSLVDTSAQVRASAFVDAVAQAEAHLPDDQRLVFVLSCHEALSYAEIAEIAGCPVGTVASRKRLAVQALRQMLAAWED